MAITIEQEILQRENERYAAMISGDFTALEQLVHEQLVYTHSSGVLDNAASWVESIRTGRTRYKNVKLSEQKVRVLDEVALVTGRAGFEVEINGQPKWLSLRFLSGWARTPRGWKFVAWQATPVPA